MHIIMPTSDNKNKYPKKERKKITNSQQQIKKL